MNCCRTCVPELAPVFLGQARSLEVKNSLETAMGLKLDWGRSVALGPSGTEQWPKRVQTAGVKRPWRAMTFSTLSLGGGFQNVPVRVV